MIGIYNFSISRFDIGILFWYVNDHIYDITLHNAWLVEKSLIFGYDMIQIHHTQLCMLGGLPMCYTHVNTQVQVISINIPKDN